MTILLLVHYLEPTTVSGVRHSWNDIIIITLAGQNFITTYLILEKSKSRQEHFAIFVIASFVFRLLMAMVIMILVWLLGVPDLEQLAINLLVFYLLFLAFELYGLLTNLRPNSDEGSN